MNNTMLIVAKVATHSSFYIGRYVLLLFLISIRGTFKSKAPLRVQFSPAFGGERGWERVKAEASPRLY